MARRRRVIIPGFPYHITHRGNHSAFILDTDDERAMYMSIATRWALRTGVRVGSFVLMGNHVHFAAVPPDGSALTDWIKGAHHEYSKWYNTVRSRTGQNWDGRYFALIMDEAHTYNAVKYIEQNPVRAGMCVRPWDWCWSSARWHSGLGPKPSILTTDLRPPLCTPNEWRRTLAEPSSEEFRKKLAECSRHSAPLASDQWIADMERRTGITLHVRSRGRPRKAVDIVI